MSKKIIIIRSSNKVKITWQRIISVRRKKYIIVTKEIKMLIVKWQ